jgi:hypothetical protein
MVCMIDQPCFTVEVMIIQAIHVEKIWISHILVKIVAKTAASLLVCTNDTINGRGVLMIYLLLKARSIILGLPLS